ncbi:Peptidoglycan-binding LysM domain protein [Tolypocladium paradoxum]|uniref:Peptidoglycan-binding LysM domain protein n=1 Tax=Tolypocladium paradoxum TaxID=94208 RepID=A0A2S4KQF1_9HYPO|nr:Peptidoglycan-binding LysM domain protein [Tolypocladium paradoxum]
MPRYSHYDTDEERLPEGMTRVGYDADTQVYTFQDADGSYWESAPGCQYGRLTRVGDGPPDDVADTEPFLASERQPQMSWRHDLMPLLNFGVLIGLCLLLLFWYLHWSAGSDRGVESPQVECRLGSAPYTIRAGDTCWAIADRTGISIEEITERNTGLDCDKLGVGSKICLPE